MTDELDIPVLADDLEKIKQALNTAYYFSSARDLADGYRRLKGQNNPSPLTRLLKENLDRVNVYLETLALDAETDEDDNS